MSWLSLEKSLMLWCDNIGATTLASNLVFHARTKHIKIHIHFIHEKVFRMEMDVRYIPSEEQIVDVFTKPFLCNELSLSTLV